MAAPRVKRRPAPRRYYRVLHNIADGKIGAAERAFLRAVAVARADVNRPALAAALLQRDGEAAAAALGSRTSFASTLRRNLTPVLSQVVTSAAVATAALETPQMALRFNLVNPRAVRWAAERSSTLIRQVTDDTREIVRSIIARGQLGKTVQEQKRLIRTVLVEDAQTTFGLTARQYEAVQNYRARLTAKGLYADTVEKRTARYAQLTLNRRATTIARTETIAASVEGQQSAWDEAVQQGYLDGTDRREWIVTPDDRLCSYCRAIPGLNPEGAPLRGLFLAPEGGTVSAPPAHPQCRCAVGLIIPTAHQVRAA